MNSSSSISLQTGDALNAVFAVRALRGMQQPDAHAIRCEDLAP
jgi:hypothetical protein